MSAPSVSPANSFLATQQRDLPSWALGAAVAGSAAAAAVFGWLRTFFDDDASFSLFGTAILGTVLFIFALPLWSRVVEGPRRAIDRLATSLVSGAFALALVPLISLLWIVISRGLKLMSWSFLTTDMTGIFGEMTEGGVSHAIMGTVLITLAAAVISIPLGLLTAIYLVEYGRGPLARAITFLVDVMTGIPSIVAGLFAFALFTLFFGPAFRAGVMGAVALALLMTPVVIRSAEEMLRLVPNELREASLALGVPKWLTVIKVVLRTSIAGIVTGIMLAVARVIGETAPLLIAVGYIDRMNDDLFSGRMMTLPVFAYRQYAQGGVGIDRAWAAALTLIVIVMVLNVVARLVSRYFAPRAR